MWSRLTLVLLGAFWLVMNFLLWRSEYKGAEFSQTPLNARLVWQKMLTSPDSSSLAIVHQGQRIGFCHLITSVAERFDSQSTNSSPEGLIRTIDGYKLDLSGNINSPDGALHARFDGQMELDRDQEWQTFYLQIIARPTRIELKSERQKGILQIKFDGDDLSLTRQIRLDQLSDPQAIFTDLAGPAGPILLGAVPFALPDTQSPQLIRNLHWSAATDRVKIGQSVSLVYRLELEPMEGMTIRVLVSRAGEILRVALPENVILVNEALTGL